MTALLVTPQEIPAVTQALKLIGLKLLKASNCHAARQLLKTDKTVHLVITDITLPDGNWCTVMKDVVSTGAGAEVIVCTRRKGKCLWNEVVWRGGYCVLVESQVGHPLREALQAAVSEALNESPDTVIPRAEPGRVSFSLAESRRKHA